VPKVKGKTQRLGEHGVITRKLKKGKPLSRERKDDVKRGKEKGRRRTVNRKTGLMRGKGKVSSDSASKTRG